ncbi:MAG: hypothetical protein HUJ25_13695 [Crocinitomicaceae bacterium]|nr:hypothetical protein [Crocinitomicaceae bacterium]
MKKLFALLLIATLGVSASAQRYNLGFGLRAGATNFLGDIGSGDEARGFVFNMELADTRWAVGPFIRYRFHPLFAISGGVTYARLQGMDVNSENRARRGRNLNFINDIFDISARYEYYPQILSVADVGFRGRYRTDYQTYFFAGAGAVIHSPKGIHPTTGEKVKLRPLMTEGKKYSPVAFQMPLGGGFFFTHNRQHRFGFEMQWSWTFTDYLDDISTVYVEHDPGSLADVMANQHDPSFANVPDANNYEAGSPRGDPTDRDNYMLMTVSYSYLIRTRNGFYRRNYSWMYGRRRRFGGTKAKF